MNCKTIVDPTHDEEVLIYAHERTERIAEIEAFVTGKATELLGYRDREIRRLLPAEIYCVLTEDNKVYALTSEGKWQVKERLYLLESLLDANFVRINQSCIANMQKVKRFDASLAGTLTVVFQNGYKDYVSRRQLKSVKERLGIKS